MRKLLIMGPPGAGKGTQAKILAEKYNLVHLSTGDILRNEIQKKTVTGLEAQSYMDAGNLVPDNVMLSMMENTLTELKNVGIILIDPVIHCCTYLYLSSVDLSLFVHCLCPFLDRLLVNEDFRLIVPNYNL